MKNKFKNLIFTSLVLINLFGLINVNAQSNMVVSRKTYINTGINGRVVSKFSTNKGYAYCVTPNKAGPSKNTTLKYVSKKNKGALVYILDHAQSGDTGYAVTQLAVWKVENNYTPDKYNKNKNNSMLKKGNELAKKALNNKNYDTTPTLSIKSNSSVLTETSDRKYYQSKALSVSVKNNTTKVIVKLSGAPKGSQIIDANGKVISNVTNNQKFYIRIPYESVTHKTTFTVSVSTSGKSSTVERYTTGNSYYQDLSVLVKTNKKVSSSTKLNVSPNKRTCEIVNGKYYGKKGNIVDYTTYSIECEKHTCEKVGNTYFGKNGNIVDYTTYSIECEKHSCEKVGDTYFGKNGNIVDKVTFSKECDKHSCEIIDDTYFGKNGNIVDKVTFSKECEKHTCEIIDDTYFGKSGNIVDKQTYSKECEKHTCEIIDDTYFGKNGNIVDKQTYSKECENHTCEIIDDTYFGKNGIEVDYETYKQECMHVCEIYDNHYYGSDGEITDEETYKLQCDQVVEVPDTGSNAIRNLLFIILGSALIGGAITVIGNTVYLNK